VHRDRGFVRRVARHASYYGVVTEVETARQSCFGTVPALLGGVYAYKQKAHGTFLLQLLWPRCWCECWWPSPFLAFMARTFGGDAITYDFLVSANARLAGDKYFQLCNQFVRSGEGSGWGMVYLVAAVYRTIGATCSQCS